MIDRTQKVLLQLIRANGPLTSRQIAQSLSVSRRTVVSEMPLVARDLEDHGARLISRRNWGYGISILDDARFAAFCDELDMLSMQIEVANYDEEARFLYIARRIIAARKGVKLDAIASELSLSRSALQKPLRRAYRFLESYRLEVVSSPRNGIRVIGAEHLIRFAMMELFAAHFHKAVLDGVDASYAHVIACEWQERQDIRHEYLSVQRESGWSLRDSVTQRIAMYLVISRNRRRDGFVIDLSDDVVREVIASPQYEVARTVFKRLSTRFDGYSDDRGECAALALYLMCHLDVSADCDMMGVLPCCAHEIGQACEAVRKRFAATIGFDFFSSPSARWMLVQTLVPLFAASRYGLDGFQTFEHENESAIRTSPLCLYLGAFLTEAICGCWSCRPSRSTILICASLISWALSGCSYAIRPLRLLVTAGMGPEFARRQGEMLQRMFPNLIASVKPCELYEIRGYDEDAYDMVLTDVQTASYAYSYPMVQYRFTEQNLEYGSLFNSLVAQAVDLEGLFLSPEQVSVRWVRGDTGADDAMRVISSFRPKPAPAPSRAQTYLEHLLGATSFLIEPATGKEEERLVLLCRKEPEGAASPVSLAFVYAAVSFAVGERHVKAVERLLYLLTQEVPVDLPDHPYDVCKKLLRRSIQVNL